MGTKVKLVPLQLIERKCVMWFGPKCVEMAKAFDYVKMKKLMWHHGLEVHFFLWCFSHCLSGKEISFVYNYI